MNKTLVLIRHAHRETQNGREQDNGLSSKGRRQVRKLFDFYFKRFPEIEAPLLWSSPKRRCLETLLPLANKLERKLVIKKELDEQSKEESLKSVTVRMESVLKEIRQSKKNLILICSHGDWIPLFLKHVTGIKTPLKKGGWAELEELNEKRFTLTWLIQDFS